MSVGKLISGTIVATQIIVSGTIQSANWDGTNGWRINNTNIQILTATLGSSVTLTGNLTGTVNGTTAATVATGATRAASALDGSGNLTTNVTGSVGGLDASTVATGSTRAAGSINSSNQFVGAVASQVSIAGSPPAGSGLFLGVDRMGYFASGAWRTYMDNSGQFFLGAGGTGLSWNGSVLNINGGGTFSGALSAATGTFGGTLTSGSLLTGSVDIGSGFRRIQLDSSVSRWGSSGPGIIEFTGTANLYARFTGSADLEIGKGALSSPAVIQSSSGAGTLTISALGAITCSGAISCGSISGDGSGLTNLTSGNMSGGNPTWGGVTSAGGMNIAGSGTVSGNLDIGAAGIGYLSFSTNKIAFAWGNPNLHAWVDGVADLGAITFTSDYRLKNVVGPLSSTKMQVNRLNPLVYAYTGIPDETRYGFLAHEVQEACASAVHGKKDALTRAGGIQPQTLRPLDLIALLTKNVQELNEDVVFLRSKLI